jgi:hypothetical protein
MGPYQVKLEFRHVDFHGERKTEVRILTLRGAAIPPVISIWGVLLDIEVGFLGTLSGQKDINLN